MGRTGSTAGIVEPTVMTPIGVGAGANQRNWVAFESHQEGGLVEYMMGRLNLRVLAVFASLCFSTHAYAQVEDNMSFVGQRRDRYQETVLGWTAWIIHATGTIDAG